MPTFVDTEILVRRLERAIFDQRIAKKRAGEWTEREIEDYKALDRALQVAKGITRRVAFDYNEEQRQSIESMLTPERVSFADRTLRDMLDLTPPGKTALATFRPLWPMSIAQLQAQVDDAALEQEPRTNPAPSFRKDALPKSSQQNLTFWPGTIFQQDPSLRSVDVPRADLNAVEGMAWNLSAPEGFPPYPRRGGVYGKTEAHAITEWMQKTWPVAREVYALARKRDAEIARAGVSSARIHSLLSNADSLVRWLQQHTFGYSRPPYGMPSAEGASPKELHAATLQWAARYLLPAYYALQEISPSLFQRQADPDEHVRAIERNYILRAARRQLAEDVFGLSRYGSGWLEKLTGDQYARHPSDFVSSDPASEPSYRKAYLLSTLLAAQADADAVFAARQRAETEAEERGKAEAQAALRPMLARGKPFTRANVQAALPGYTVDARDGWRTVTVYLIPPEGGRATALGSGRNLTAAMDDLRVRLGL